MESITNKNIILLTTHRLGYYGLWPLLKLGIKPSTIITSNDCIKHKKFKYLKNVNYVDWHEVGHAFDINTQYVENNQQLGKIIATKNPDLIIALGWFTILPEEIFNAPTHGTILLHPSKLPKYRGGAPITWQIINGEKTAGITLFYLDKGIDNGDIIDQTETDIDLCDDVFSLSRKLYKLGGDLIENNILKILNGTSNRTRQNHDCATTFKMRSPKDGKLTNDKTVYEAYNFIRAQTRPYPGAFIEYQDLNDKLIIWKADHRPYKYKSDDALYLKFKDGFLKVLDSELISV